MSFFTNVEDNETFCGGEDYPGYFSAYVLDDITKPHYKYFQCVTQQLYNDLEEVFPDDTLTESIENVGSALECLQKCEDLHFELGFIQLVKSTEENTASTRQVLKFFKLKNTN
jgi:hypothetical protein